MSSKKISVGVLTNYAGHSIKNNGTVTLKFKINYEYADKAANLLAMLNQDIEVSVKRDTEVINPGSFFKLKTLKFDKDGNSTLELQTIDEYSEIDQFNKLITEEMLKTIFKATIDEDFED